MFTALVGVTLPTYILFNINYILSSVLGRMASPAPFTVIRVMSGNLYFLIFIMDPIVIMRNQDVREVLKITVNKLRRRGREKALPTSSKINPTAKVELQVQRS